MDWTQIGAGHAPTCPLASYKKVSKRVKRKKEKEKIRKAKMNFGRF
jgi:hypothetical protein